MYYIDLRTSGDVALPFSLHGLFVGGYGILNSVLSTATISSKAINLILLNALPAKYLSPLYISGQNSL